MESRDFSDVSDTDRIEVNAVIQIASEARFANPPPRSQAHLKRPVRWLVSELVWTGWCWFIVREKYCWLTGLDWLKPTSEQVVERFRSR